MEKSIKHLFKNIKAKKLNSNDPKVIELINKTIEEQNKILALKNIDIDTLRKTIITI